ncbi:MAG: hypothetical protein COU90_01000 [Candidatus Ryanbacteria bacterium CG10_big_fil_rev_8_21_14_0_10_43_42]|uniref:PDZ domain-containing protein n=1 Tax=Candidatus Ryanbacteria bacterium CG10_big_fil_rev_8_21_14_0_10_43_42 TaxID=1974864 RepID=A0A2M8KY15_9BACT|nr:MAG: hypothetical protein COU90_01000 [Candidatus Ryanbacteria bacterium CG10_big_fil_rev_8_21_14_0_10_43_42]
MNYEDKIITAVKKVMPAVVSITATQDLQKLKEAAKQLAPLGMPQLDAITRADDETLEQNIPGIENGKIRMGGGSGFLVDESGIILTNRHVVADQTAEYSVVLHDENTYPARVIARDPIHDIAILQIVADNPLPKLPVLEFAEEKELALGQTVIAIGNALGEFKNTVSTGIVSGLSRFISAVTDVSGHQERLRGLIQTDAAINPGNSGGPLIDITGRAIGVNVAIVFGAQNIGFAIPIKKAKRDLDDIRQFKRIRRPFLGVRYVLINKMMAKKFGLPVTTGALVLKEAIPGDHAIIPGSAADKSGLKEGDILLACNKKNISEKETLEDILEGYIVGDTLSFDVLRNSKEKKTIKVKLEEQS